MISVAPNLTNKRFLVCVRAIQDVDVRSIGFVRGENLLTGWQSTLMNGFDRFPGWLETPFAMLVDYPKNAELLKFPEIKHPKKEYQWESWASGCKSRWCLMLNSRILLSVFHWRCAMVRKLCVWAADSALLRETVWQLLQLSRPHCSFSKNDKFFIDKSCHLHAWLQGSYHGSFCNSLTGSRWLVAAELFSAFDFWKPPKEISGVSKLGILQQKHSRHLQSAFTKRI